MRTRNTFGLINPKTGERYKDIIHASLSLLYLSHHNALTKEIYHQKKSYQILMDTELRQAFKNSPKTEMVPCIISFQDRKDGRYAIARLYHYPDIEQKA